MTQKINYALSIMFLFPEAKPGIDFRVTYDPETDIQEINAWNIDAPQPTEEELIIAWGQVENISPAPSQEERLQSLELIMMTLMGI